MHDRRPESSHVPDGSPRRPLTGIKVVDFSTLLPGPLASLILADAGAEVVKIEKPGGGDDMRGYGPFLGSDGANFLLLNRGKVTQAVDLKAPEGLAVVRALLADADVLIEQFRPGVMERLGLSYADVSADNPGLIYCSITGYGQTGPKAHVAAHDLNYVGDTGMLSLVVDDQGTPSIPAVCVADIGGGAYPAVMNIMLALIDRGRTGHGRHLDISMSDNVFPFLYWALGNSLAGSPARPSGELVTGATARYAIYRTRDQRFIAAAPIEEKFWRNFCAILELEPSADKEEVAAKIATKDADEWMRLFEERETCCSLIKTIDEALADKHFEARGCFDRRIAVGDTVIPGLPLPIVKDFGDVSSVRTAPTLPPST